MFRHSQTCQSPRCTSILERVRPTLNGEQPRAALWWVHLCPRKALSVPLAPEAQAPKTSSAVASGSSCLLAAWLLLAGAVSALALGQSGCLPPTPGASGSLHLPPTRDWSRVFVSRLAALRKSLKAVLALRSFEEASSRVPSTWIRGSHTCQDADAGCWVWTTSSILGNC